LTKAPAWAIITMKSEPRTRLAPQRYMLLLWQSHKVNRHLVGVAVDFLAGLAFREVSFTRIVIVHFFIWKVIRISTTSLSEDGANRLRVCMNALHRTLAGVCILHSLTKNVNRTAGELTKPPAWAIITMKSEPRTRLAPQSFKLNNVAKPQKQPSLCGSGGCFFCAL